MMAFLYEGFVRKDTLVQKGGWMKMDVDGGIKRPKRRGFFVDITPGGNMRKAWSAGVCVFLIATMAWGHTGFLRVQPASGIPGGGFSIGLIGRGFSYTSDFDDSTYTGGSARFSLEYALIDGFSIIASLPLYADMFGDESKYGMGDAQIGIRYSIADIVSIAPFVLTGTGQDKGLFRYYTSGAVDGGVDIALSLNMGNIRFTGGGGYVYHGVKREPDNPDEYVGRIGVTLDLENIKPFVEFVGRDQGGFGEDNSDFGPDIAYITPGVSFNPTPTLSLLLAVDIGIDLGKSDYLPYWGGNYIKPWENDYYIATGPGKKQPWAVNVGIKYNRGAEKPEETIVRGSVIDAETGEPIVADISFPLAQIEPIVANEEGRFEVSLGGEEATIMASAEGYKWMKKTVSLKPGTEIDVLFPLTPQKTIIKGKVVDADTKGAIMATITFDKYTIATDEEGLYSVEVEPGTYKLHAESEGYSPAYIELTIEIGETAEVNFVLVSEFVVPEGGISIGEITSARIRFKIKSAYLKKDAKAVLDKLAQTIKENPEMKIEIQGHACEIGTEKYNYDLSVRRAKSVRDYLVQKGIKKNRLTIKGFGEKIPIVMGHTEEARAKNRRVEFKILN